MALDEARSALLCRVGDLLCTLPLEHVAETMRPLPIETVPGASDFVLVLAVVRGAAVPVIDAARLFGQPPTPPARFVILKVGERKAGIAVDAVLGIRTLADNSVQALPPLLQTATAAAVSEIGMLDGELLLVLETARMMPDEAFATFEPVDARS